MSVVGQLYRLQLVDSDHAAQSQRLAEVVGELGMSDDVIRAREEVADTEGALSKLQAKMRALELDIAAVNSKLKVNQDRLYSGRVKNPKELGNLQEEAAALGRRTSELEDHQLELMIGIEEQEAELAERQARLLQIETQWSQDQASLDDEKGRLELALAELEEQREGMRARIGAGDLDLYDDLCARLGGVGVVQLKGGLCRMCNVDVPTGLARAVERGEMHFCPTCNRLLFGG